jgi:hypothetical protein
MRAKMLITCLGTMSLCGCGLFTPFYTLPASNLKASADDYGDVMDDFTDRALLRNVLRARDYAPLNFSDLSAISGAFSTSAQVAPTIPFGPLNGVANAFKFSAGPTVMGSSSPVLTVGTLNTQGFMLTMIQPVSTTYILSKWNSHPHALLLYLFVKSIRFPDGSPLRNDPDSPADFAAFKKEVDKMISTDDTDGGGHVDMRSLQILDPLGQPVPIGQTIVATTPVPSQSPAVQPTAAPTVGVKELGAGQAAKPAATYYSQVTYVTTSGTESTASPEARTQVPANHVLHITSPTAGTSGISAYNVYVSKAPGQEVLQTRVPYKIGQDWDESEKGLADGPSAPVVPGTSYQVSSDYNVFQTISSLNDGQLHAGNVSCPEYIKTGLRTDPVDFCPPGAKSPFVQFYREYPAQIVLCVRTKAGVFDTHEIAAFPDAVNRKIASAPSDKQTKVRSQAEGASTILLGAHGGQAAGGGNQTGGPPSGNATATGAGTSPGNAGNAAGAMGQVTLNLQPSRISAMVSDTTCNTDQIVLDSTTEQDFEVQTSNFTHIEWRSIAEVIQYLGALARYNALNPDVSRQVLWMQEDPANPGKNVTNTLFTLTTLSALSDTGDHVPPRIRVSYGNARYGLLGIEDKPHDHSLQIFSVLNELISIAKISGALPVSQPVQVLP